MLNDSNSKFKKFARLRMLVYHIVAKHKLKIHKIR